MRRNMAPDDPPVKYLFSMDRWTPGSLPARRFAQYVEKLAALLGSPDAVHFKTIRKGSARQVFEVDPSYAPEVWARVGQGACAPDVAAIRRDINKLLMEDGQIGYLKAEPGPRLIEFPGRKTVLADEATVHQRGSIDGTVMRVGGRDNTVPVSIETSDGVFHRCSTTRDLAKRLAPFLFEGEVRLFGKGKWVRSSEGDWKITNFDIIDFEVLPKDSLRSFLADMRAIDGSDWNSMADPQAALKRLKED